MEEPAVPYGSNFAKLDDDLFTCIADKERFDEFVSFFSLSGLGQGYPRICRRLRI